MVNPL